MSFTKNPYTHPLFLDPLNENSNQVKAPSKKICWQANEFNTQKFKYSKLPDDSVTLVNNYILEKHAKLLNVFPIRKYICEKYKSNNISDPNNY